MRYLTIGNPVLVPDAIMQSSSILLLVVTIGNGQPSHSKNQPYVNQMFLLISILLICVIFIKNEINFFMFLILFRFIFVLQELLAHIQKSPFISMLYNVLIGTDKRGN